MPASALRTHIDGANPSWDEGLLIIEPRKRTGHIAADRESDVQNTVGAMGVRRREGRRAGVKKLAGHHDEGVVGDDLGC